MNRQIRVLGGVLLACFSILFVQLNIVQVIRADEFNDHEGNSRGRLEAFNSPRGRISTADGVLVADSVETDEGSFAFQRTYPEGDLYAHSVGYFSYLFGSTGVESTYDELLSGEADEFDFERLENLFVDREFMGDVTLSIRDDVQRAARDALGEQEGSVVAIDPRSGDVLALWSFPSFDPNFVATNDTELARQSRELLVASEESVLRGRTFQERFFPGSTFKVVTATAGLESGLVTEAQPVYPDEASYTPPQTTRPLQNFGGSVCGGDLFEILARSCNTSFARMGVETVGPERFVATAESFGFNDIPPIDLPGAVESVVPTNFAENLPALAQSSIGQNEVQATPLQMALVACAVANDGVIMEPHVVSEVLDREGEVVDDVEPTEWQTPMSSSSASVLRRAMVHVVEEGSATGLAIEGYEVGGKTGTAQLGTDPPTSHAWIIGFAGPPGGVPEVAVAVIVEGQPGASEQTGGRVAAPIARAVMEAVLAGD